MKVFESPVDSVSGGYRGGSLYEYYRDSIRPELKERRELLESLIDEFPESTRNSLVSRIRDKENSSFIGALWEVSLYHRFANLGCEVQIEPEINGFKPDFLVKQSVSDSAFIVEATVVFEQDPVKETERGKFLVSIARGLKSKQFDLMVWADKFDFPSQTPSVTTLVHRLQRWLDDISLDDEFKSLSIDSDVSLYPRTEWSAENGWKIEFTAVPRPEDQKARGVDRISESMGTSVTENTISSRIREAIRRKLKKYKFIDVPFVIALNVCKWNASIEDIERAFWGDIVSQFEISFSETPEFSYVGDYRSGGRFSNDDFRSSSRPDAILFAADIDLWTFIEKKFILLLNPNSNWKPLYTIFGSPTEKIIDKKSRYNLYHV